MSWQKGISGNPNGRPRASEFAELFTDPTPDMVKAWNEFLLNRRNAKRRGIPFLLTLEQWLEVWMRSGHYLNRGRKSGQYQLARFGDEGPYAVGNVKIITIADNMKELERSAEYRAKLSAATSKSNRGRHHSIETRIKLSVAGKRRIFSRSPLGTFT